MERLEKFILQNRDEFDDAIVGLQRPDMLFDGNARVIADTLPEASEAIEECAFARIGTTDNRYAGTWLPAYGNVRYGYAGF